MWHHDNDQNRERVDSTPGLSSAHPAGPATGIPQQGLGCGIG
jgi:hypothetical protein